MQLKCQKDVNSVKTGVEIGIGSVIETDLKIEQKTQNIIMYRMFHLK